DQEGQDLRDVPANQHGVVPHAVEPEPVDPEGRRHHRHGDDADDHYRRDQHPLDRRRELEARPSRGARLAPLRILTLEDPSPDHRSTPASCHRRAPLPTSGHGTPAPHYLAASPSRNWHIGCPNNVTPRSLRRASAVAAPATPS